MRRHESSLALAVAKLGRQRIPLLEALRAVMRNPSLGHYGQAEAARLLVMDGSSIALRTTALTFEGWNDRRAIQQLVHALKEARRRSGSRLDPPFRLKQGRKSKPTFPLMRFRKSHHNFYP